jgi:hypothetical protein
VVHYNHSKQHEQGVAGMPEKPVEQLTEDPDDSDRQETTEPAPLSGSPSTTFTDIVIGFLDATKHPVRTDLETGELDKTLPEAVQLMAKALAEHFSAKGEIHGTDTPITGKVAEDAKKKGQNTPLYLAFESTLGKLRMTALRQKVKATIHAKAAVEDELNRRALRTALTSVNRNSSPYKGMGYGHKYTLIEAHDLVVEDVKTAARRYLESSETPDGGSTKAELAKDVLARAAARESTETQLAAPRIAAIQAAYAPTAADMLSMNPLENLLRWDNNSGFSGQASMDGITRLAKQCAKLNLLSLRDLDALSTDVARRVHHPFGLLDTKRHTHMLTALYLFAGEAPSTAMDFAWRLLAESTAADMVNSGHHHELVRTVLAALNEGIKLAHRYVRWLRIIPAQPAAMDVLRLLAAIVTAHREAGSKHCWPEGLLDSLLDHYGVCEADIPAAVELLQAAFPLDEGPSCDASWRDPSIVWNTAGSAYSWLLVSFAYSSWLSQADLEDLKEEADQHVPLAVLSELRDCMVRSDASFAQGKRRIFTHESVLGSNKWLKRNLNRRANTAFAKMGALRRDAYQTIRGLARDQLQSEIQAAAGHAAEHRPPSAQRSSPTDWFVLATTEHTTDKLTKLASSNKAHPGMTTSETRAAALTLLGFLNRARTTSQAAPRPGQKIQDWLSDRIEETNVLGNHSMTDVDNPEDVEDMNDEYFIDLYEAHRLASLLEETVRYAQEEEDGK